MKHYVKELIILLLQLFAFYIYPLLEHSSDAMGMVVTIILATLVLSFILGIISNNKIKYLYPIVTSVTFIPSVFIYYNESALIHSVWYLVITIIGLLIGSLINIIFRKIKNKQ